ncbi:MAG: ion channel [Mycoplasma sp.]
MQDKIIDKQKVIKYDKFRGLYKCMFIRETTTKKKWQIIVSLIYNILMSAIPVLSFVPIFGAFNQEWQHGPWLTVTFVMAIVFIVDYILRLTVIRYFYDEKNVFKLFKKQLQSVWSNYQFLSGLSIIVVTLSCGMLDSSGIIINPEKVDVTTVTIAFNILLFGNLMGIYSRIIVKTINQENVKILKKLLNSKYKLLTLFILFTGLYVLLFAYIIYSLESPVDGTHITSMSDAIYLAFITMTTVGFGDITVATTAGRVFIVILACLGICTYAWIGSFFVNVFVDFQNIKKSIQHDTKESKDKEYSMKFILSSIDNIVLKNLLESGLIDMDKFEKISSNRNIIDTSENYEFNPSDFVFDYKEQKLYFMSIEMGVYISDIYSIKNAENAKWLAVKETPKQVHKTVLYNVPFRLINEIKKKDKNFPVIFSSKTIDPSIKRMVIYQKKPFKASIGEINVQHIVRLEKDVVWRLFGDLTNMKKEKFESNFSRNKSISVIIVKDITRYEDVKLLDTYGINSDAKLDPIIYLT